MKKVVKKVKLLAKVNEPAALPAAKTVLSLPEGRGGFTMGALILVLVTLVSLAASVLFYFKTTQAVRYTAYAGNQLQTVNHRMSGLQSKINLYEKNRTDAAGKISSCNAENISGDKNGDAKLVCTTADGSKKVILESIRTSFEVKDKVYAPIIAAYLASSGSTVYVISGVKGNETAFHVWTYDLTTGKTADLATR